MDSQNENQIHCPKCNSTQITANKKGFSGTKAVAGAVLTGGIGLLAGTIGSNKVKITCLACGHVFKPGDGTTQKQSTKLEEPSMGGCLIILLIIGVVAAVIYSC